MSGLTPLITKMSKTRVLLQIYCEFNVKTHLDRILLIHFYFNLTNVSIYPIQRTFQYNSLFLVSHKTSCTNLLHLQTVCLKTSTNFFLIKCSFLQRINRGAAGLLGAETIISSKNSDFQKRNCKVNYCCTIQSGSGHLQKRECIFKIS